MLGDGLGREVASAPAARLNTLFTPSTARWKISASCLVMSSSLLMPSREDGVFPAASPICASRASNFAPRPAAGDLAMIASSGGAAIAILSESG